MIERSENEIMSEVLRIREQAKMTQQELADLAGVSVRSVWKLERNRGTISLKIFLQILDALGYEIVLHPKRGEHDQAR